MIRVSCLLAAMTIALGVQAEVYKCRTPGGETEFSDTPCKAGSSAEVVPDRDTVSAQQQDAARARLEAQKREVNALEARRTAVESVPVAPHAAPAAPPPVEEAYSGGCYDNTRGRESNCAEDPYRQPLPDRPIVRPAVRPVPR